ncbi:MAG TPA: hypothetical protein PK604_14480 [Acetivibrio clariflavus]|nr:hypothetical protein [Acetivibrio clariflavus]
MAIKIVGTRKNSVSISVFLGVVFGGLVLFSAAALLGFNQYRKMENTYKNSIKERDNQIQGYQLQIEENKRTAYIPVEDIKFDTKIEEHMVEEVEIMSSIPGEYFMTEDDMGKKIKTDLKAGLPIMKYMLEDELVNDDIRNVEFNTLLLQSNIKKNDFIDVRIRFPNGEDYIVLTKKQVSDIYLPTNTIWLNLGQKELMTLSSATVDAYLREGTKLYVVKYVDPQVQKSAIPTYPHNVDVQMAMMADPNILEKASIALANQAREALEQRIGQMSQDVMKSIKSGIDIENNERKKSIEETLKQESAGNNKKNNNQNSDNKQTEKKQNQNTGDTDGEGSDLGGFN